MIKECYLDIKFEEKKPSLLHQDYISVIMQSTNKLIIF
jgi:hypothetical protein